MPERGHPDYGVLRAIVRDSTDAANNGTASLFLDSDGCVSSPHCHGGAADQASATGGAAPAPCLPSSELSCCRRHCPWPGLTSTSMIAGV